MGNGMTCPSDFFGLGQHCGNWGKSRLCPSAPVGVSPYGDIPPAGAHWGNVSRLGRNWGRKPAP
jgi:hypothetical protein